MGMKAGYLNGVPAWLEAGRSEVYTVVQPRGAGRKGTVQ